MILMLMLKRIAAPGESGLGKTTFINTLFTTTVLESEDMSKRHQTKPAAKTVQLEMTKAGMYRADGRFVHAVFYRLAPTHGFAPAWHFHSLSSPHTT